MQTEPDTQVQRITLKIDYHVIPLTVRREDEACYRRAAEELNRLWTHYLTLYPRCTPDKLWVYVALDVAVRLESDIRDKSLQPVIDKIAELNGKVLQAVCKEK